MLRSASDAPSYLVTHEKRSRKSYLSTWKCQQLEGLQADSYKVCESSDCLSTKYFIFIPALQQHKELQWCMASSNRERSQSNMPKQHKRSQRTHQMREKPQPACRNSELEILVVFIYINYCYRHRTKKRKKYGDDLHPSICKVYVPNNLVQRKKNVLVCWHRKSLMEHVCI